MRYLPISLLSIWLFSCGKSTYDVAVVNTKYGEMQFVLHEQTPKHRKNFVELAKNQFFDGMHVHRVVPNFIIQMGDPNTKTQNDDWGNGGTGYLIPAEIDTTLTHKRGAVGAARQDDSINPERSSNGSQFYIVHNSQGAPHLDGKYTVFGQLISGWNVLDRINQIPTNMKEQPLESVMLGITVKKMKKTYVDKKLNESIPLPTKAQAHVRKQ